MAAPTVSFNGYDLASSVAGLKIIDTDPYRPPNRDLTLSKIANSNRSVNSATYGKDKKTNVKIEIGQDTRALFDASMDQLHAIVQAREATLIFNYGSSNRQWTATMSNESITDNKGGWAAIDIEFECADPFGYDTSSTNLFTDARTGSTATINFTVGGTAEWQYPIITMTLTAVTGGSNQTVTISNPATGQTLNVTRAWSNGDMLVIDSTNTKKVTVNGTEVASSGGIPEWNVGPGSVSYTDTFTTRTRTLSGVYTKRYF